MTHQKGWWRMHCFNALSLHQQKRLVEWGNLPIDYRPEGPCPNGAEIEITTVWDVMPGPRFYCRECAILFLGGNL